MYFKKEIPAEWDGLIEDFTSKGTSKEVRRLWLSNLVSFPTIYPTLGVRATCPTIACLLN